MTKENLNKFLLVGLLILVLVFLGLWLKTRASETPATTLTIDNEVPVISVAKEQTASTASAKTPENGSVTFTATASDDNGDSFQLFVCKTDSITPGANPTCESGASMCNSNETDSGDAAVCTYNLPDDTTTNETQNWYAFACDDNGCSDYDPNTNGSQGNPGTLSDGSQSPIYINHRPDFTAFTDDTGTDGLEPGDTVTWTVTFKETDTDNTVDIYVCSSDSWSEGGGCGEVELCKTPVRDIAGNGTTDVVNTDCTFDIPTVKKDGDYAAYGFVVDNEGLASRLTYIAEGSSTESKQKTDSVLRVANVTPNVNSGTVVITTNSERITNPSDPNFLISDNELLLTSTTASTTTAYIKYTAQDYNGCGTDELPVDATQGNRVLSTVGFFRGGCLLNSTGVDAGAPTDGPTCEVSDWDVYDGSTGYGSNAYMIQQIDGGSGTIVSGAVGSCVRVTSNLPNLCTNTGSGDKIYETGAQSQIDIICTFPLNYLADPTTTDSYYEDEDWYPVITVMDTSPGGNTMFHSYPTDISQSSVAQRAGGWENDTVTIPMAQSLQKEFTVATIAYGNVSVGGNASDDASTKLVNKGNTGIDQKVRAGDTDGGGGTNPEYMCRATEYPTCSTTTNDDEKLPASYQKYSGTDNFVYESAGTALTNTLALMTDTHCLKPIKTNLLPEDYIYWRIKIPDTPTKKAIQYKGLNTISAIVSDSTNWY
uniref:Uncharacterized protein n=1 Tax=candidate division CPR3 bacterium TaxID=2268181 RepID=A0A7C4M064_UNCC3